MPSNASRLRTLVDDNPDLGRPPDFDASFADAGVSSLNAVACMKIVEKGCGVSISTKRWAGIGTLRCLVDHLDSHSA